MLGEVCWGWGSCGDAGRGGKDRRGAGCRELERGMGRVVVGAVWDGAGLNGVGCTVTGRYGVQGCCWAGWDTENGAGRGGAGRDGVQAGGGEGGGRAGQGSSQGGRSVSGWLAPRSTVGARVPPVATHSTPRCLTHSRATSSGFVSLRIPHTGVLASDCPHGVSKPSSPPTCLYNIFIHRNLYSYFYLKKHP